MTPTEIQKQKTWKLGKDGEKIMAFIKEHKKEVEEAIDNDWYLSKLKKMTTSR